MEADKQAPRHVARLVHVVAAVLCLSLGFPMILQGDMKGLPLILIAFVAATVEVYLRRQDRRRKTGTSQLDQTQTRAYLLKAGFVSLLVATVLYLVGYNLWGTSSNHDVLAIINWGGGVFAALFGFLCFVTWIKMGAQH